VGIVELPAVLLHNTMDMIPLLLVLAAALHDDLPCHFKTASTVLLGCLCHLVLQSTLPPSAIYSLTQAEHCVWPSFAEAASL